MLVLVILDIIQMVNIKKREKEILIVALMDIINIVVFHMTKVIKEIKE